VAFEISAWGVFGVAIAGLGILDVECRIDLVADDFGEGSGLL